MGEKPNTLPDASTDISFFTITLILTGRQSDPSPPVEIHQKNRETADDQLSGATRREDAAELQLIGVHEAHQLNTVVFHSEPQHQTAADDLPQGKEISLGMDI